MKHLDDKEKDLVEAIEDVTANILDIPVHESNASAEDSIQSHVEHLEDFDEATAFIATLQDAIVAQALTETKPKLIY